MPNSIDPFKTLREEVEALVGKPFGEAKDYAIARGLDFRVTSKDGFPRIVTCDLKADRVNVAIVDGIVTEVSLG